MSELSTYQPAKMHARTPVPVRSIAERRPLRPRGTGLSTPELGAALYETAKLTRSSPETWMQQPPDLTTTALRKAAWRLIPLIALGYGTAYMDRVNVSYAAQEMNRDLHFSNTIYGIGAGIFFLSYAVCEIPSNLLLFRFGARRWLSRIMMTWGIIAMAMIFVRTPLEFYTARFLLGFAEAGFFPGIVYYIFQWFPAQVRARSI